MITLFDTSPQGTVFKSQCHHPLDKSLTAKLYRMTPSYCTNASSVSTLDGRGADIAVREKEKDGRNWLHVDPNNSRSSHQRFIDLWDGYYYYLSFNIFEFSSTYERITVLMFSEEYNCHYHRLLSL